VSIRRSVLGFVRRVRAASALLLVLYTFPNLSPLTPQVANADPSCTASLYGTSDSVTGSSASSSTTAVEVGVKFTPAFATTATAVRFYRSVADSGGYTVHLWDSDGNIIGSGSDSGATGTGWISIDLDDPVSLTAGAAYVSSYHAAHGRQQVNTGAYQTDESNTMISTPPDGGVYHYDTGTTSAINPNADTYVSSVNATTNYGSANPIYATDSQNRAFLRFNTNAVVPSGNVVTGGTLKIYVTNIAVTTGGFEAHPEDNSWTDSSVTWNTQPTWNSTALGTSSTPTAGSWVTVSLPASAINYRGDTSLGLRYTVANSTARFASVEDSTHKPELTVDYSAYSSGTTTLNPTADTYVSSANATTNYATANPVNATESANRAFVRFDTSGIVPAGTVMTAATLKVYVTNNAVSTGAFEIHPEADTWTESGATWNNQPTWDPHSARYLHHTDDRQLAHYQAPERCCNH
jgi:Domain of unknown function (DUF4082)